MFLLFVLLWMGPPAIIAVVMIPSSLRYGRLYREYYQIDPRDFPLPLDSYNGPIKVTSREKQWRIIWEKQSDPTLEKLRGRIALAWRVAMGYILVVWLAVVVLRFVQ
jgi:hypothetical protein